MKPRALALAIDLLLLCMLLAPLSWLLHGNALGPLAWLLATLLVLGFWQACGATPGKLVCGLRIVDASHGGRPGLAQLTLRWLLWLLSVLPLGLGLLWAAITPGHQGLHDKFARTAVVRVPSSEPDELANEADAAEPDGRPRRHTARSYLLAHWRGELPLPTSFWLNTVLLVLPLLALALGLAMQINVRGSLLSLGSAALLLVWGALLLALVWGAVGCWRAASAYARSGHDPRRALAAHVALLGLSGVTLYATAFDVLPQAGHYLQLARGIDPLGNAAITLAEESGRLSLKGPIGRGDGAEFMRIAGGATRPRVLELESPGGRLAEAQRIADFVHAQRLRTRVTGRCEGVCALIFLAGAERQLVPAATVGLSGAATGLLGPLLAEPVAAELAPRYRALGTPDPFIARLLQTPPGSRWQPSRAQWVDAGLLEPEPSTLDIALPAQAQALADARFEIAENLRAHPTWYWLDRYLPGLIDAAAQRMEAASATAQGDAGLVQAEGQALVSAMLPGLLQSASNELRVEYLALWSAQLKSARQLGAPTCASLLAGQAAVKRQLPEELIARENAWLVQAAMLGAGTDFRPVNANEQVVLQHRLGQRAPAILAGLFQAGRKGQRRQECDRSIEILDLVNALPLNLRPVAARAIFQD